jgi:beta-N-acetylhexosaminidase
MRVLIPAVLFQIFIFHSCAQAQEKIESPENDPIEINLDAFLLNHPELDKKVDSVFKTLNQNEIISQLIMPAVGRLGQHEDTIKALIRDEQIGGILLLNGTKDQFTNWVKEFNDLNQSVGNLPFLYSADAEPSLVNRKIIGSKEVPKANTLTTAEQVTQVAETISNDLNDIGINYNFSPVVDMSTNKTVGYRGFGSDPLNIVPFSNAFIDQSQKQNIIATAKHFPGHGLVTGDTHKSLQTIDGELKELGIYPPLIENGVLSIMIAHIGVQNNPIYDTKGMPATTSKVIVTDLLRNEMKFNGLIVTDAMNMGGVAKVPNASSKAIEAGCDILLMPLNARKAHSEISKLYSSNSEFQQKVNTAAKRIIRMKICLALLD